MIKLEIEELEVGMSASVSKIATDSEIVGFSEISRDYNPIHLDNSYAKKTKFGKRIAHGMMSSSLFSGIFGTKLPGVGCLYLSQNLKFKKPIFIDDKVVATVVITKICLRRRIITFDTTCEVKGITVIQGVAEIYVPK